jgi:hypothetical protein
MVLKDFGQLSGIADGTLIALRTQYGELVSGVFMGIVPGKHAGHNGFDRADKASVNALDGDWSAHIPEYDFREAAIDKRRKVVA